MKRVIRRRSSRSRAGRRRVGKRAWRVRRVGFVVGERVGLIVGGKGEDGILELLLRGERRDVRKD